MLYNIDNWKIRLQVTNHPNYFPTLEKIKIGLNDEYDEVKNPTYQLRQDEWFAKIEENKLRSTILQKK